jgi:hypothetical protein
LPVTGTRITAPDGLAARGRAFWNYAVDTYEFSAAELQLLTEVCRTLDTCEALDALVRDEGRMVTGSRGQTVAHPALAEVRQSRALLGRLLAQLELPDVDGCTLPSPVQARGRRAAATRWGARGSA